MSFRRDKRTGIGLNVSTDPHKQTTDEAHWAREERFCALTHLGDAMKHRHQVMPLFCMKFEGAAL
jgi:hypothetical protein